MRRWILTLAGWFVLLGMSSIARADEKLAGVACRSVHLGYPTGVGTAFYNEVTVDRSAPGTYFCAIGWNKGYFGIQEQGRGRKVVIFSVWDSNQDKKDAVDESLRVKTLHRDEKVRIGRFGRRGDGRAVVPRLRLEGRRHLSVPGDLSDRRRPHRILGLLLRPGRGGVEASRHVLDDRGGAELGGFYSFVEDFRRDKVSQPWPARPATAMPGSTSRPATGNRSPRPGSPPTRTRP